MIALEYQPGEREGTFHYNQIGTNGGFEHWINTNNYHPITMLPDAVAYNPRFLELTAELASANASLEDVVLAVYTWSSIHRKLWNE